MDYDVIIIGAGHNGLITAAYAAQAGHRVAVFERREIVGGAVSTQEIVPGYQFDLGGSAHILIHLTPIIEELHLDQYGLEYIFLDPLFFAPFPDGESFFIYRDVERTVAHLNDTFPGEGDAYRRFVGDWRGFSMTVRDAFLAAPSPFQLGKTMVKGDFPDLPWQTTLRRILRPYGEVVRHYFSEEKVQAALIWMAAQSGPPPSEPLTGPLALWHPLYHESGIARPRGGSGMLTQALKRHIEAHGGDVFTSATVSDILIEQEEATGIRAKGEIYTSRAVVAATHARETFDRLLPIAHRPDAADELRVGNGFGAMLRLALDAPVKYAANDNPAARRGLQLLCHSPKQIQAAYGDYLRGQPADNPPLVAMTFSAVDDSLAPPGGAVLWLWGQYYPYELADGKTWKAIAEREADHMIDVFERYAPNTRSKIIGRLFQHPEWLERKLGLFRGNVMHLEMSFDQMFGMRPLPGWSGYKTPIAGLYLTGASTHPGGGIMGASGRNAARRLLRDL